MVADVRRRIFSQPSLADAFVKAYSRAVGFLEDIAKTFEWAAFDVLYDHRVLLRTAPRPIRRSTMFKIVLLQQCTGFPTWARRKQFAIAYRFGAFTASLMRRRRIIPRWRLRQRIETLDLSEKLLAEVNRQLDRRGMIIKRGTLRAGPRRSRQRPGEVRAASSDVFAAVVRFAH